MKIECSKQIVFLKNGEEILVHQLLENLRDAYGFKGGGLNINNCMVFKESTIVLLESNVYEIKGGTSFITGKSEKESFEMSESFQLVGKAFQVGFDCLKKNPTTANLLINDIKKNIVEYINYSKHYISGQFVIQSSGWGKTLTTQFILKNHAFGIYINSRNIETSSGYPIPYQFVYDTLNHENCSQAYIENAKLTVLNDLCDFLEKPEQSNKLHSDLCASWFNYCNEKSYQKTLFRPIFKYNTSLTYERFNTLSQRMDLELPFLFVFDELSDLNIENRLNIIRSFSYSDPTFVFALFTDTHFSLIDLAPSKQQQHPSDKVSIGGKLSFKPFIRFEGVKMEERNDFTLSDIMDFYFQYQFGRPLWKSMLLQNENLKSINNLARYKLLFNFDGSITDKHDACLAVLAQLVPLKVSPTSVAADSLVAKNLGTVMNISEERKRLSMSYIIEPVLVNAALDFLINENGVDDVLDSFVGFHLRRSVVDTGEIGEILMSLLCVICTGKCYGFTYKNENEKKTVVENHVCNLNKILKLMDATMVSVMPHTTVECFLEVLLHENVFENKKTEIVSENKKQKQTTSILNSNTTKSKKFSCSEPKVLKNLEEKKTIDDTLKTSLVTIKKCKTSETQEPPSCCNTEVIKKGIINFRQIVRFINKDPSQSLLKGLFIRQCAMFLHKNHSGANILIPVYLGDIQEAITDENMSAIMIQIKNHQIKEQIENSPTSLLWENVFDYSMLKKLPYISLDVNFSTSENEKNVFKYDCFPPTATRSKTEANDVRYQFSFGVTGFLFDHLLTNKSAALFKKIIENSRNISVENWSSDKFLNT